MKKILMTLILAAAAMTTIGCTSGTTVTFVNKGDETFSSVKFGGASVTDLAANDYSEIMSCETGAHTVTFTLNGITSSVETDAASGDGHYEVCFDGGAWVVYESDYFGDDN